MTDNTPEQLLRAEISKMFKRSGTCDTVEVIAYYCMYRFSKDSKLSFFIKLLQHNLKQEFPLYQVYDIIIDYVIEKRLYVDNNYCCINFDPMLTYAFNGIKRGTIWQLLSLILKQVQFKTDNPTYAYWICSTLVYNWDIYFEDISIAPKPYIEKWYRPEVLSRDWMIMPQLRNILKSSELYHTIQQENAGHKFQDIFNVFVDYLIDPSNYCRDRLNWYLFDIHDSPLSLVIKIKTFYFSQVADILLSSLLPYFTNDSSTMNNQPIANEMAQNQTPLAADFGIPLFIDVNQPHYCNNLKCPLSASTCNLLNTIDADIFDLPNFPDESSCNTAQQ